MPAALPWTFQRQYIWECCNYPNLFFKNYFSFLIVQYNLTLYQLLYQFMASVKFNEFFFFLHFTAYLPLKILSFYILSLMYSLHLYLLLSFFCNPTLLSLFLISSFSLLLFVLCLVCCDLAVLQCCQYGCSSGGTLQATS